MERRSVIPFFIVPVIMLFMAGISAVHAAPAEQDTNLLQNPSFEQPFVNGTADGWSTWALVTEKSSDDCLDGYQFRPKWNMETGGNFVADGTTSQYIGNNWDTWSAGVLQTVDASPGVTYRFAFSAKGRISNEESPAPSESGLSMNIRAGIDPDGSGQWNDGDVVWSGAGSPHDSWQTFTVEATATGDSISVFTAADFGVPGVNQCRQFIDTWYDGAQLVALSAPPADTPPPAPAATQPSAPTPTALSQPTTEPETEDAQEEAAVEQPAEPAEETPQEIAQAEEQTAQPQSGGTICVNAFHDENGNGLLDENEGYMAGVTMVVASESDVVGQAISDGSDVPTCFQTLASGPYQVAQQLPGRLEMTTSGNALVAVTDGHTVQVAFGSRLRQEPAPAPDTSGEVEVPVVAGGEEAAQGAQGTGFDPLALSGLGVILLGVIALGLLLFFVLRR